MPITPAQSALAEQAQMTAATAVSPQVRLVVGPGTGKSAAIERRVAHVLSNEANPANVYVISFTRATCAELSELLDTAPICLSLRLQHKFVCLRCTHWRFVSSESGERADYSVPKRSTSVGRLGNLRCI